MNERAACLGAEVLVACRDQAAALPDEDACVQKTDSGEAYFVTNENLEGLEGWMRCGGQAASVFTGLNPYADFCK